MVVRKSKNKVINDEDGSRKMNTKDNFNTKYEDKIIKTLGKKLHFNRRNKSKSASFIPKSFKMDGLDYLLELCDHEDKSLYDKDKQNNCQSKRVKNLDNDNPANLKLKSYSTEESDSEPPLKLTNNKRTKKKILNTNDINCSQKFIKDGKKKKEDIYGRLVISDEKEQATMISHDFIDKDTSKESIEETVDKSSTLYKSIKGVFNRLTEQTVHYCLEKLEALYDVNSRHEVNKYILEIIKSTFLVQWKLTSRMIAEHALLLAALASRIGLEIGAFFLENMAVLFDQKYRAHSNDDYTTKKGPLHNIITLLSHFLNLKICDSVIIYDILKELIDQHGTIDLELIITILKNCGPSLRRANPNSMKEIIQSIHAKSANHVSVELSLHQDSVPDDSSTTDSGRVKFMMEILTALKNNNFKKIPGYEVDQLDSYLKILRNLSRRTNNKASGGTSAHYEGAELNMRYRDLLSSHKNGVGKWWIVGAAIQSTPNIVAAPKALERENTSAKKTVASLTVEMEKLAKRHGMNTQIRRTIFATLMSSNDFLAAHHNLLGLGYKKNSLNEREIFNVILQSCCLEKNYNPFYAHLTAKFCLTHRDYRRLCEFSMWDKMANVESLKDFQITNLSKFISDLLLKRAIALFILKKIDFLNLSPKATRLIREILLELLSNASNDKVQKGVVDALFVEIARSPKSRAIYESLRLFVRHFVLDETGDLSQNENFECIKSRWNEIEELTENL